MKLKIEKLINTIRLFWVTFVNYYRHPFDEVSDKESSNKELLIIVGAFPPAMTGGVYRPLSWTKYGAEMGWKITILTLNVSTESEAGQNLLATVPKDIEILRVNSHDLPCSFKYSQKICNGGDAILPMYLKALSYYSNHVPSAILVSGPPFHTFITGMSISKTLKVPLFLDYRDEWTLSPFTFVSTNGNESRWERKVLSSAREIFFTTRSQEKHARNSFGEYNNKKTLVIENGIDGEIAQGQELENPQELVLTYAGVLGDHCLPEKFLSLMSEFFFLYPEFRSMTRIRFLGRRSKAANSQLQLFHYKENIELLDQVSPDSALQYLKSSSVNILILNDDFERYIPGKLYDYVAAKRPAIAFDISESSEIAHIFKELDLGLIVRSDPKNIDRLKEFFYEIKSGQKIFDEKKIDSWLNRHSREALAKKLFSNLDADT